MAAWSFRRAIQNAYPHLYDRTADHVGGQAVVYGRKDRVFECYVNGVKALVDFPDMFASFNDHGNPSGVRLRFDYSEGAWYLYAWMFAGDGNPLSEWNIPVF